ncbi:MAG: hypothetical protein ACF8XB_17625 [Planctomycetota bacterium JB042]
MIPVRAELYRMARLRGTLALLPLPALAGVLWVVGARVADRLGEARRLAAGGDPVAAAPESGFGPLADGLRTGSAVLTLILLLLGALSLVREREQGTLSLAHLAAGRAPFVAARAVALLVFAVVAFLALGGACALVAAKLHGLRDVVEEGFVMAEASTLWMEVLRGAGATLPALVAAAWFGLAVSAAVNGPGAAVGLTLAPVLLFDALKGLFPDVAARVFVGWLPLLSGDAPIAHLTDIARGYSDVEWGENELLHAGLVPGAWAIALLLVAAIVTRRRSV